jgi:hypothetical protein
MAKKSTIGHAADEVRTVAGKALGAAAAAATVVESVAAAFTQGGDTLKKENPTLQRSAATPVERPIAPRAKKSAASKKRSTARPKSGARSKIGRVKIAAKKKHHSRGRNLGTDCAAGLLTTPAYHIVCSPHGARALEEVRQEGSGAYQPAPAHAGAAH